MIKGPAMSRTQAARGVAFGIECVRRCVENGDRLLATGEMGIGNTTTSSAIASVLLDVPPARATGRGAGLTDEAFLRKQHIIEAAIACNRPDPDDALDVLAKVGGFDIAAMCGVFLGGSLYRIPVLVDGVISAVAALAAYRLCEGARLCMVASHVSAEPAARMVLDALGLSPLITAGLRLGEGTGAVAAMPMLDMALDIYQNMETFADYGM